jgi:hypothetical protein
MSRPAPRLSRLDDDFDCGILPENVALIRMLLGVSASDPPANLIGKIEAALFSQVTDIAAEIGDGMLIACST